MAGHANRLVTGTHSKVTGTMGDLYMALSNDVLDAPLESFPTSGKKLEGIGKKA